MGMRRANDAAHVIEQAARHIECASHLALGFEANRNPGALTSKQPPFLVERLPGAACLTNGHGERMGLRE